MSALQADSKWSSHPISVQVHRPEDIDDIFDTISYQKVSGHPARALEEEGRGVILPKMTAFK